MKRDVGVLFVHGIGQQPEGDTLLAFGEPLVQWTDRWLHRSPPGAAAGAFEIRTTKLTPSKTGDDFPPHARAVLHVTQKNQTQDSRWLLAESWWGGDVQAPPFGRFAAWLLTVGAWTVVSHMTKGARKYKNLRVRQLMEILATGAGIVVATALQLGVLLLSVLALIPIPKLRRGLSSLLLTLTGVVGDCYVLVESDLQRSAIVTRTREALAWLARNCHKVVVIAHSQGAAVAHYALRSARPPNVVLLVTLGSGLGKLDELARASKTQARVRSVRRIVPLVALLMALLVYIVLNERRDDLSQMAMFLVGFSAFLSAVWVFFTARVHWTEVDDRLRELSLTGVRSKMRWLDVYASKDPVPNGEILPTEKGIAGVDSCEVVNWRSFLRDHTTYWQNRCEFIPRVLRTMSAVLELNLFTEDDERALDRVARRHRSNVFWLGVTSWATLLSVVLLFWLYGDAFLARGTELATSLGGTGTPFESLIKRVGDIGMFVLRLVFRDSAADVGFRLLGAAVPLVLIGLFRYAYRARWRWWDSLALEDVFSPGSIGRGDHLLIGAIVVALGLAPLAVVLAWPLFAGVLISHVIAVAWIVGFSVLVLLGVVGFLRKSGGLFRAAKTGDSNARGQLKSELQGVAGAIVLLGFMLLVSLPALEGARNALWPVLAILMSAWFLWKLQNWFVREMRARLASTGMRRAVVSAPLLIAVLATTMLVAALGPQRGVSGTSPAVALLSSAAAIYALVLMLVSGIALLLRRLRPLPAKP